MKNYIVLFLFVLPSLSAASSLILPETTVSVDLSNTDVNRIVCVGGDITDVKFSSEKAVSVQASRSNAYIKFQIQSDGISHRHIDIQTEFFITCAGSVYTLIAQPKKIQAQTIRLGSDTPDSMARNIELYGSMPLEEQIVMLLKRLVSGDLGDNIQANAPGPDGARWRAGIVPNVDVRLVRYGRMEGIGLGFREFYVRSDREILLTEQAFLTNHFGSSIVAISVDPLLLPPGHEGRVFIIEKGAR